MKTRSVVLSLACWAALAAPGLAQQAEAPAQGDPTSSGEKLPAQLPSVTIRGEDRSTAGNDPNGKLSPTASDGAMRLRLPEPPQRRATREANRSLVVSVTPSTLETPAPLPEPRMPYTHVEAGYGPPTQYVVGLYDARFWGPALGVTELSGRAGSGWSGWRGREGLDWPGIGRFDLAGEGFGWQTGTLAGGAALLSGAIEHGERESFLVGARVERGLLDTSATGLLPVTPFSTLAQAYLHARPGRFDTHQLRLDATAQHRTWGALSGPEGLVSVTDFWSISDTWQLEGGLGGGQWGFEPILNPLAAVHYRPWAGTHAYASVRTESLLPDFREWYLPHPARDAAPTLQAERADAWGELGASHRFNERLWATAGAGLKRSQRLAYLGDLDGDGRWTPLNAPAEQWTPMASARMQIHWHDAFQQTLSAETRSVQPLGLNEQRIGTSLTGTLLERRLAVTLGLDGVATTLGAAQSAAAGSGRALFAAAEVRYALDPSWTLGLVAEDVPLMLAQPAPNYYVPLPILTANVSYEF